MSIKKFLCKMAVIGVLSGFVTFAPSVADVPIIPNSSIAYAQEDDAYMKKHSEWSNFFLQYKYNEALNVCNEWIQINPNRWNAYSARGSTYQYMHQYDKALADFDKAIELINISLDKDFESLPSVYGNKARIYEKMHQPNKVRECQEKELEAYTLVIQKKPDDRLYYTLRANVYDELGEHQKAIADYKTAISLPHHLNEEVKESMDKLGQKYTVETELAQDYFMCGNIYQKIKDYANAIEMFTKAIELYPDKSLYWNLRGQCYEAIGDKAKAKADYVEYQIRSKGGN